MMIGAYFSEVVRVICALLSLFIPLFGFYIIAHGHYGFGGGFVGGVFVAVGVILLWMIFDEDVFYCIIFLITGLLVGSIGMLVFLVVGVLLMLFGGAFLDYVAIEIAGVEFACVRYFGIMVVEVVVGFTVFGVMVLIFDVLSGRGQ